MKKINWRLWGAILSLYLGAMPVAARADILLGHSGDLSGTSRRRSPRTTCAGCTRTSTT